MSPMQPACPPDPPLAQILSMWGRRPKDIANALQGHQVAGVAHQHDHQRAPEHVTRARDIACKDAQGAQPAAFSAPPAQPPATAGTCRLRPCRLLLTKRATARGGTLGARTWREASSGKHTNPGNPEAGLYCSAPASAPGPASRAFEAADRVGAAASPCAGPTFCGGREGT